MAGLAEQWFRIADEDKDGKISGGEAVRFFTRSGLPKDVLGQVGTAKGMMGPPHRHGDCLARSITV